MKRALGPTATNSHLMISCVKSITLRQSGKSSEELAGHLTNTT